MEWRIKYIFNFTEEITWKGGYFQFGFHDYKGNSYVIRHSKHWLGELIKNDEFTWTAGSIDPKLSEVHIPFDLKNPMYISRSPIDESLAISSGGNNKVFKLFPDEKKVDIFIDMKEYGVNDIGNCVFDKEGNMWINEITGCRLWQFDSKGQKKKVLGNGKPGFQKESTNFDDVQFNWIYDIRLGPDNNLYILDSRNYAVREIDFEEEKVKHIAGTGEPGYSGDGGLAKKATFGSNTNEKFDGPWSMALDKLGNIFIGDTHNHVVRMIEKKKKKRVIATIVGNPEYIPSLRNSVDEKDLLKINLPKICSMDFYNNELFIPEWDGDLIVLEKND